jgi:hypothetical protein
MHSSPDFQWRIKDLERELARLRADFDRAERRRWATPSVDERLLQLLCIAMVTWALTALLMALVSAH